MKYFFVVIVPSFRFYVFVTSNFATYIGRVFLFEFHPCSLLFTTFSLVLIMDELCNKSYKYQLLNKLGNNLFFYMIDLIFFPYLKNFLVLIVIKVFKNTRFLPHFCKFGEWLRCVINMSDVYHLFLPNIDIFTQESRLSFAKKLVLSIANAFRNIRFFPHFYYCLLE